MGAVVIARYEDLEANHKSSNEIKTLLTGDIGKTVKDNNWETCAISVSYALNQSGAPVVKYDYQDKGVATGKVRAKQDGAKRNYIYSVIDMKVYLNNRYGIAENYKGTKQQMISKIKGRKGIIAFGHRHIDLWDGNKWHNEHYYIDLWVHESTKLLGIFFWVVKEKKTLEDI